MKIAFWTRAGSLGNTGLSKTASPIDISGMVVGQFFSLHSALTQQWQSLLLFWELFFQLSGELLSLLALVHVLIIYIPFWMHTVLEWDYHLITGDLRSRTPAYVCPWNTVCPLMMMHKASIWIFAGKCSTPTFLISDNSDTSHTVSFSTLNSTKQLLIVITHSLLYVWVRNWVSGNVLSSGLHI